MRRTLVGLAVGLLVAAALWTIAAGLPGGDAAEADLILTNARIWTGDESRPWAEAVAIRGDRIMTVGGAAEVRRHRTVRTRVIELGGRLVTPGFIDNHTHFNQAGALLLGVNLLDVAAAEGFIARVREARDRLPAGAWMLGGAWGAYEDWAVGSTGAGSESRDPAERFRPTRQLIDSISPETPALLSRWDRTENLANGRALELAGLSCGRPVAGLECVAGEATGMVAGAALERVRAAISPRSLEQRLAEARLALAQLREFGVTTIHDITPPEQFAVYQALREGGELTVRVNARPTLDKWDELAAVGIPIGFGDEWIRIGGLKGFVDGIMGNSQARFYEPYRTTGVRGTWRDSTNTGAARGPGSGMEPAGNMERNFLGADAAGLWPMVHAIGDEAIDTVIDIYEKVVAENGPRDRRFRIIHTQVIRGPETAQRMARLGIIAEVQPYHTIDDMRWMEERIGTRARWAYAFRTLHEAGVRLSFGSDWPGTNASWYTANPLHGIYAAVARQTLEGQPEGGWFPEERIDVETALRAYTVNNAFAAGEEAWKGTIAPGRIADLVALDLDLFEAAPSAIRDGRVVLTVVGGEVVHEAVADAT